MTKKYNKIKVKDNMKVEETEEEVVHPKEKLNKVVDGQPKKVKKGLFGRLISGVLGPEGISGVGSYVNEEIIIPAVKNIIVDGLTSGIHMLVYRDGRPHRSAGSSRHRKVYRPETNYRSRYDDDRRDRDREPRERIARSSRYSVEEYIITDRLDASHVLTALTEHADRYDTVSVADYYDLIGVTSEYTDETYGWTLDSITLASIVPVRGGYILKFPAVEVI